MGMAIHSIGEMPIITLCADCGKLVKVTPTIDQKVRRVLWGYCDECLKKRVAEARVERAKRMIQLTIPS
jgi:DNA-directed RNA polymerase subunit RPC12/RpoP